MMTNDRSPIDDPMLASAAEDDAPVHLSLIASPPAGRGGGRDLGRQVAERLAQAVFSGEIKPGGYLPKELELCQLLGVSRASVRGGMQTLAGLGIVERRVGQGTVVRDFRDWNVLDPIVTGWLADYASPSPDFLRAIFEFRFATEPLISRLAAENASAHDLALIEAAYREMVAAAKSQAATIDSQPAAQSADAVSTADIALHTAIYRATGNLVWSQLAHILRPAILLVIRTSNTAAHVLDDSLRLHGHLVDCIRARQPGRAQAATIALLSQTARDLGIVPPSPPDAPATTERQETASGFGP